ncbi:uncharacterized protein LOC123684240 [Harmonia axyridis]|uniref:uncharacterized protein LOC123684240 n=1 Tax=Harmonia axyridis TaxID=115357 RepID=UPI001E2775FD|nr:uncharacterized protein LOC123684240 [Harmonia axyridis]
MEENPKNRGRKHIANKSKYNKNKPKPTGLAKSIIKTKSLAPNWDRYEEELTSGNDYVPLGSDFALLANAPISRGSHFQFKSETNKIQELEKASVVDTSGLFNIDLNLIGLSLSTIPFNERCDIPDDYFSESQRKIMLQTAKTNDQILEETLSRDNVDVSSTIDTFFASNKSVDSSMSYKSETDGSIDENNTHKEEVDSKSQISEETVSIFDTEIASLAIGDVKKDTHESAASILESESLSQWLDDVLGD